MMRRGRHDNGQAAVLFVIVASVLFIATVAALAVVGGRIVERVRAQSVADAVALASLDVGHARADVLARRHGAELISWTTRPSGDEVTVIVRLGGAHATARATNAP